MGVLPLFSQKRAFEDWIGEADNWFMKLHQWPISEVAGEMIAMLKGDDKSKDRDSGDLIYKQLSKKRK